MAQCPVGIGEDWNCRFAADGSKWLVSSTFDNQHADRLAPWIGADRADRLFPEHPVTVVFDTATGRELARVPHSGQTAVLPDGKTLATYSFDDDRMILWDIPPRTAIHPAIAWAVLGLALALSGIWWGKRCGAGFRDPQSLYPFG